MLDASCTAACFSCSIGLSEMVPGVSIECHLRNLHSLGRHMQARVWRGHKDSQGVTCQKMSLVGSVCSLTRFIYGT